MADESTEPSEMWTHPFAEEVDSKIKPIKNEIRKLKKAQAEQKQALLETQRQLANFIILNTLSNMAYRLQSIAIKTYDRLFPQLTVNATTARTKALSSDNPMEIAVKFHRTCGDILEKLGEKTIKFP